MKKRLLFVTGTRADFGKLKTIILHASTDYEVLIFVTGMHMLTRFGLTWNEVRQLQVGQIYPFVNQNENDSMSTVLSKTIQGLSDVVSETQPNLIVVHGDRVEALAGALVGTLMGILVAHIEGGEVSGTIDEMIRHAISKIATYHFVSNEEANQTLCQMGESPENIFVVGSPDVDIMLSDQLPKLEEVRNRYGISFDKYAIAILHPVVTEQDLLPTQAETFFGVLQQAKENFIVIQPNNDPGHVEILVEIEKLRLNSKFKVFPSMRFEYFLTLLKHAEFIIGNSSAGVREAPYFGVPCINLGTRQHERARSQLIINSPFDSIKILESIRNIHNLSRRPEANFGTKDSAHRILSVMSEDSFWKVPKQKYFLKRQVLPHQQRGE